MANDISDLSKNPAMIYSYLICEINGNVLGIFDNVRSTLVVQIQCM